MHRQTKGEEPIVALCRFREARCSMINPRAKTCGNFCLCVLLSSLAIGQQRSQQEVIKSCREFVETFYAWYVAKALSHGPVPASDLALKHRPYVFSSKLFQQLSEDSDAEKKAPGDLVGLDFDPFLATQDFPAERYVAERITMKDGRYWVEVHGVRNGKESELPDVTPELIVRNGRWIFVNFHYQDPSRPGWSWDLLRELKDLRRSREQGSGSKSKKP
jgi:hypothetical protein